MASIPAFPSIDLSKLDFSKLDFSKLDFSKLDFSKLDLSKLDVSRLDLSKFDITKLDLSDLPRVDVPGLPGVDTEKVLGLLRDAAYVVIGFGVLSVQQAQVRRRELVDRLGNQPVAEQLGLGKDQIEELVKGLEARFSQLDDRLGQLEGKLDAAVDALGERLPEQAGALLGQAHEVAKAARKQMRGLLVNAA